MKLITDWCRAANDSMAFLPSSSVSPKAYSASLVENEVRASANVIQPRAPAGNADKERASAASLAPSSFAASGGAVALAPSHLITLIPYRSVGGPFCSKPTESRHSEWLAGKTSGGLRPLSHGGSY